LRKIKVFALLLVFALLAAIPAASGQQQERVDVYEGKQLVKSVVFQIGRAEYFVDGRVPGEKMDAAPFIENGRTFVPVRYLGYALGLAEKDVSWDNEEQKAALKRGGTVLEMTIGVPEVVTNGQAKAIDVAPILKSEPAWRTYLPARFVAEGLGYEVDWDGSLGLVVCWLKEHDPWEAVAKVAKEIQGNPYVPEGWKRAIGNNLGVYIPPGGENRYTNVYFYEKGTMVQIDSKSVTIRYPCREFATESTDRLARELLLANIADPDMVEQVWEYGLQKTGRDCPLPLKIFPGAGPFEEIWVTNADFYVAFRGFYKAL